MGKNEKIKVILSTGRKHLVEVTSLHKKLLKEYSRFITGHYLDSITQTHTEALNTYVRLLERNVHQKLDALNVKTAILTPLDKAPDL